MNTSTIGYAIAWYFIFLISVTAHEAAHAWAAKRGGDPTAEKGGQVSLNPWPHIKRAPIGMVLIPIISIFAIGWPFGFAVTPYDPIWAHNNPRKAGWMAAAGPIANLVLLLIGFAVIKIGLQAGFFLQPAAITTRQLVEPSIEGLLSGLAVFMSMLFSMNLILFVLNIIPMPPLDGSGVISLFLKDEAARKFNAVIRHPAFSFIGLLLVLFVFSPIIGYLFAKVMSLIYWGQTFHYSTMFLNGLFFT
jgi:Zn-dependent protease